VSGELSSMVMVMMLMIMMIIMYEYVDDNV